MAEATGSPLLGKEVISLAPSLRDEQLRKLLKGRGELFRLRDLLLATRSQFQFEYQKEEHSRRFADESLAQYMNAQHEAMKHRTFDVWYDELCERQERCQTDYDNLKKQEIVAKEVHVKLSTLEYRLMGEEQAFGDALEKIASATGIDLEELRNDPAAHRPSESVHSETPSLLAKYYDRRGDMGVYQERIAELDHTHHEALVERNFLLDQGEEVDPSEATFEEQHLKERQEIIADYELAEDDANRLANECAQAGIVIPDMQGPLSEDMSFLMQPMLPTSLQVPSESRPMPREYIVGKINEVSVGAALPADPPRSVESLPGRPHGIRSVRSVAIRDWLNAIPTVAEIQAAPPMSPGQGSDDIIWPDGIVMPDLPASSSSTLARRMDMFPQQAVLRRHSTTDVNFTERSAAMRLAQRQAADQGVATRARRHTWISVIPYKCVL